MKCGHDSLSAINNPECPECAAYVNLRIGPPDPCPACGTPWVEHDGPTTLCRALQESQRAEREAVEAVAQYKARLATVEAERDMAIRQVAAEGRMRGTVEAERDRLQAVLNDHGPDGRNFTNEQAVGFRTQRDDMRAALEAVEWVRLGRKDGACPWCGNLFEEGHAPDCPRQRALDLAP